MNTDTQLCKKQHAKVLGLVERGGILHGRAPRPIIAIAIGARADVIPHPNPKKIRTILVPGLCKDGVARRGIYVDKLPRDGNHGAPALQARVQARKVLYTTRVASYKGVRDAAIQEWVEYVRGVQCRVWSCFDFKVIMWILQSTWSNKCLYNFLATRA